ncbi:MULTISPECIES: mechanosensitive ion channel family protein [Chitinibacter]|uniref:mechanosensitive ion channel family protein n=1 Tax=Chitinibacter TaxID=230666 RepID=UPI00041E8A88|nr:MULTISPECIES: mechanosensitive ion channel family protein [Chitinibacter]
MATIDWRTILTPPTLDKATIASLVVTAVFIVVLLVVRFLAKQAVMRRTDLSPENKRRWLVTLRNLWLVIWLIGLFIIWGSELQTLAVSMVAIAAAIVLATKEMIMCLMGSIYRTSTHTFSVGDRIEFNGRRGQVIDTNLLSFTLNESSHATNQQGTVGRQITFPNSLLLGNPVFNETRQGLFVLQTVHVEIERGADWAKAEQALLAAGEAMLAEYRDELEQHLATLASEQAVNLPPSEPRVRLDLDEADTIALQLQLLVPLGQRAKIEQQILRQFLRATQSAGYEPVGLTQ